MLEPARFLAQHSTSGWCGMQEGGVEERLFDKTPLLETEVVDFSLVPGCYLHDTCVSEDEPVRTVGR